MIADALIVGGGLAGSAAAIHLARAGRSVVLLERDAQPAHKVCGEFLSREALAYLAVLGIDVDACGAVPIERVRLAGSFGVSDAKLPFRAKSLTRRTLDEQLLQAAVDAGVDVRRAAAVTSLKPHKQGWQAGLHNGPAIMARAAFLATGKHDLRGYSRPPGKQPDLIAFKMYWRLAAAQHTALEDHVELLLYRGGYAGLQPVEDGIANLCCLVHRSAFQRMGGRWSDLLTAMQTDCPHLEQRLRGAEPLLAKPLAITAIPYGYVREHGDGFWALGDQAAVIPSFTGDGMSIALHSASLAARLYLAGENAEAYQQMLCRDVRSQVALASRLSLAMLAQPQRSIIEAVTRLWPGAMRTVAERTRIAPAALLS